MAHSDTLIFLTNVTWTFFLFILIYLVFVLFFIPSFFKKVRLFVVSRDGWILDGFYALISVPATLSNIFYLFNEVANSFRRFTALLFLFLMPGQFVVRLKLCLLAKLLSSFFTGFAFEFCALVNFNVRLKFLCFAVGGSVMGVDRGVYFVK